MISTFKSFKHFTFLSRHRIGLTDLFYCINFIQSSAPSRLHFHFHLICMYSPIIKMTALKTFTTLLPNQLSSSLNAGSSISAAATKVLDVIGQTYHKHGDKLHY